MKKIITAFVFCFLCGECLSQAGEWVWIKGDTVPNQPGNLGVQGVPSPTNNPHALYEPCEWTDLNGNFWMYGGIDHNAGTHFHNELWKYDPGSNEWTWISGTGVLNDPGNFGVQGVPSPNNHPPGLGWAWASWVDLAGNLWMFGGGQYTTSYDYADLWKYDITANEWTWMKGPGTLGPAGIYGTMGIPNSANYPWSRTECAAAWTDDSGNLWLFGGTNPNVFNDLWRFNIATNTWTWMKGSSVPGQGGTWGTLGVEDSLNTPGGRLAYDRWKDKNGNLWLFGGYGFDAAGNDSALSDLWRYNIFTNNWTWMNGSNSGSAVGVYGTKCFTSSVTTPSHRSESRTSLADPDGNFWMFGGFYEQSIFSYVLLNDVWKYCVSTNQWTWESGDSISSPFSNWGTMGIPSPTNKPNGRFGSVGWMDHANHIYIFGGASDIGYNFNNDLWKYTIDTTCGICPTSTGVHENNFSNELLVFPNPTNSSLTISFSSSEKQPVELRIYNTLANQVYFSNEEITIGKFEKEINVEKLSDGIYFLQLKTKEGNLNRKIIINH